MVQEEVACSLARVTLIAGQAQALSQARDFSQQSQATL
jgi:hypothetical protein